MTTSRTNSRHPGGGQTERGLLAVARWLLLVAVSFGLLALGLSQISRSVDTASPMSESPSEAYPSPDFRLASLDGGAIGPQDYSGEVVIVELWATWCGPCRLQARFLEELHRELEGKGVRFLADFLNGDTYYRTERPNHNLDRCRTQFRLLESIIELESQMVGIVERL